MANEFDDSALFEQDYKSPDSFDDSALFESDYQAPPALEAEKRGDFMSGVYAGGNSFMALMNYSKAAIGALSENEDWIREGIKSASDYEAKAAEYGKGRVTDWDAVNSAGDFIDYMQYGLGTLAPFAAESATAGIIGGVAGSTVAPGPGTITGALGGVVAKQALKETLKHYAKQKVKGMTKDQIEKKIRKNFKEYAAGTILPSNKALVEGAMKRTAAKMGATMSSLTATLPIGQGDIVSNLIEDDGTITKESARLATALAIPYAALDVLPEFIGISKLLSPGSGGRLKRAATGFVTQAPVEAATEVAQEEINIRTRAAHDPDFDPYGREAMVQRRESAILGGAGGGVFGLAQGAGKGGVLNELELDISSNIREISAKDLGGDSDYNQAIIDGIMGDEPIDLPDHGMLHGSADEALKADLMGNLTMGAQNQAEIDAQEKAMAFDNRRRGTVKLDADQPLPVGQQIDVLYNEALKSKAPNINQFIIEGIYGKSGKLVDHGQQQRPAPLTQAEVNQQAIEGIEQVTGAQPTPELEGELLGMVPAEEARPVSSEFQPVDPADYDRPAVEQNLNRLYQESKQIEQETGGGNALQNLASDRGLDTDAFIREGLDPADIKAAAKKGMPFGKPLFKRGGMTPDEATEILTELGIDMSETSALDIVHNYVTSGEAPMIPGDEQVSFDLDARKRGNEKNIERYEDLLEEITTYDQLIETDGQQAADEFFYQNRRFDTDAQGVLGEFIEEVGVESETLEKLIGKAIKVNPERAEAEFDRLANKDASDAEITEVMHKLIDEPERREEGAERVERRKDIDHRKDIETMSQGEKDAEIQKLREDRLKNPKTKVAGRGAFDEDADLGWKHVGAIDGDGMGFFNSIIGHDPTDEIMQFVADEIVKFNTDIVRFYHFSGDEFASRAENDADHKKVLKEMQEHFENTIFNIDAENASGDTLSFTISGFGMSYGTGETYAKADIQADLSKQERERAGKRAKKGYSPGGITAVSERTGLEADLGERGISAEEAGELVEKVSVLPDEALGAFPGTEITAADTITEEANKAAASPENNKALPTKEQIEAESYAKGHPVIQGLDIAIENPAGSKRKPQWPAMTAHYGDIVGYIGADGDAIDVFINPDVDIADDNPIFIIDQYLDGKFDEHKVMMGFASEQEASDAYNSNYTKDWDGLKNISELTPDEFKTWLNDGDTTVSFVGGEKAVLIEEEVPGETVTAIDEKPADIAAKFDGKEITYEADIEETGETVTVTVDAGSIVRETQKRIETLKSLLGCVT